MEKETVKNVKEKEPEEIPTEGVKVIPSKSYLRNVIARRTRHRLSQKEMKMILDNLDTRNMMRVISITKPDWAENKLNIRHSHKVHPDNYHDKVYTIEKNFLPNKAELGDRDKNIPAKFNRDENFACLIKCVHTGRTKAGVDFNTDEYELVIYCPKKRTAA